MSSAIVSLVNCGEMQRKLFYRNFLSHNKIGEMMCVNDDVRGDTLIFERWNINGVSFVATFCLLSEESMIVGDRNVAYKSHELLLDIKTAQQREIYAKFVARLEAEGHTVEEVKKKLMAAGEETNHLDFKPYTREMLEDRLPPGKKTILGDRNSMIEVLERQKEIPSDLQRARLNRYLLVPSDAIELLKMLKTDEELRQWEDDYLEYPPRELDLSTTLPFLRHVIYIEPTIYSFPDREAMIDN